MRRHTAAPTSHFRIMLVIMERIIIPGIIMLAALFMPTAPARAALPTGTNAYPTAVLLQSSAGTFTDLTTAAANDVPGDIALVPEQVGALFLGGALFVGAESPFDTAVTDVAQAGVGGSVRWEYWNGSVWSPLPTNSPISAHYFLATGPQLTTWTLPYSRWTASEVNGIRAFWIRIWNSTAYTTRPTGSTIALRAYQTQLETVDASGDPMRWSNTIVISNDLRLSNCGGATEPIASINLSTYASEGAVSAPGTFALALPNIVYQQQCTLELQPPGFIPQTRSFGPQQRADVGRHSIRFVFEYPLIVSLLTDEDGNTTSTATFLGRDPALFFKATPGEHGLLDAGGGPYAYASDPATGNTQLADVHIGTTTPTVIRFDGTTPCAAGTSIAAGANVRCRSLLRTLAVTVVDSTTNEPVRDATIRIHTSLNDPSSPLANDSSENRGPAEQRSNIDGYASFGLRTGSYGIEIRRDPYPTQPLTATMVTDGVRTSVRVALRTTIDSTTAQTTTTPSDQTTPATTVSQDPVTPSTTTLPSTATNSTSDSSDAAASTSTLETLPLPTGYAPGDLIALGCSSGMGLNHPCRAVYEIGTDGRRHAFPHFQVFLTWYTDIELRRATSPGGRVKTINTVELTQIPLGALMGVKSGTRLVKFTTVPTVYDVDPDGTLRPIPDEATAIRRYGLTWANRVLDINDAFFTNYRFGAPLS